MCLTTLTVYAQSVTSCNTMPAKHACTCTCTCSKGPDGTHTHTHTCDHQRVEQQSHGFWSAGGSAASAGSALSCVTSPLSGSREMVAIDVVGT